MKYAVVFLILATWLETGYGQTLKGLVMDSEKMEPLPFTTIAVSGQSRGTISNSEGFFVMDRTGLSSIDSIQFSHVGFATRALSVGTLEKLDTIWLQPATLNLLAVEVRDRELTVKEILERVRDNFETNHPNKNLRQQIFYHRYEKTPWSKDNQIRVKSSDFTGLDKNLVKELFSKLPDEFVEFQDAVVDLYSYEDQEKLIPVEAISLEESSMKELSEEMEDKLGAFFDDIAKSQKNEDVYYKFRTGIFGAKMENDNSQDSLWQEQQKDSLHYLVKTLYVRRGILSLFENYADIESDNWEFVNKQRKYKYQEPELTVVNDEWVYKISFSPNGSGLYAGVLYVSTANYAVLQLEFAFAPGVQTEKFKLLGLSHSLDFKKGKVIYERVGDKYLPKYIYAEKHERALIERDFSIMKKEKRFLFDKELNEIKLSADLDFDMQSYWEILVLNRQNIDKQQFEDQKEPMAVRYRKEYTYDPEIWTDRTIIAPTQELKTYKRKSDE